MLPATSNIPGLTVEDSLALAGLDQVEGFLQAGTAEVIGAAGSNFADELLNQMAAYRHAVERKYKDELDEVQRRRNEIRRRGSELRDLVETNRALEDRQLEAAVRSARRKRIRQLQGDAQILQDDSQMRVEYRTRTRQRVGGSAR